MAGKHMSNLLCSGFAFGIYTLSLTACIVGQAPAVFCFGVPKLCRTLQAKWRSNALGTNLVYLCCSEASWGGAYDHGLGAKQALDNNTEPNKDNSTSDDKGRASEFSK